MPADHGKEVREALVTMLRADPAVSGIVGQRSYGEQSPANPTWPFIRIGLSITTPFEASCWDGSEHDLTIHAFAKGPYTDQIESLAKSIISLLDDAELPIDPLGLVNLDWTGKQIIRDTGEAGAYHAIITFSAATYV